MQEAGQVSRETYLTQVEVASDVRRAQANELHEKGLSYRKIALEMGAVASVCSYLIGRKRQNLKHDSFLGLAFGTTIASTSLFVVKFDFFALTEATKSTSHHFPQVYELISGIDLFSRLFCPSI
jgi:hypothetical protein